MGWSTRLIVLSADGTLHRLARVSFDRMLRAEAGCKAPVFAAQRVRMASVAVEVADGIALGVRHVSFSILTFDAEGVLDVSTLHTQQVARLESMLANGLGPSAQTNSIVETSSRFIARGGSWVPDNGLRRRIEAAATGLLPCHRVQIVG